MNKSFAYRMTPAYRHGSMTPWGGDSLRRLFGKDIPSDRCGESLEVSTLPGLCSTLEDGTSLETLCGGQLPLMLKLLDAKDMLSVQVHPDDEYAGLHENKLGKTEAWLILHAEPGAKLVYGLKPGTDLSALTPETIEEQLRWVSVQPGDCCFIPAGMVHAIGSGIVVYEIQQTSDVTYRFWDWGRVGTDGKPRTLHWQQACAVSDPDMQLDPSRGNTESVCGGSITRYPVGNRFCLERLSIESEMALSAHDSFLFLTALDPLTLCHGNETLELKKGETVFVPKGWRDLSVRGQGDLLLSAENA